MANHIVTGRHFRSTRYDAFNPKRTALPALGVVRYIVAGLAPADDTILIANLGLTDALPR